MGESSNIVVETAERIFADLCDPQTVNSAKDDAWKADLWKALAENGLTLAWVSDDHGGSGASLADGFELLSAAGRFAVPVPLAETMLAGWLLSQGGIVSPEGAMTVAPVQPKDTITLNADGTLSGRARGVPFAREAQHVAVLARGPKGATVALVAAKDCRREEDENLAGEPLDNLVFDKTVPLKTGAAPAGFDQTALMLMGCTVRSLQIAGSLQYMLTRSVNYSQERVAFEKKISKFQAVQHNLAKLAGETAAAVAAAGSAAETIANGTSWNDEAMFLEAAAAKIRCAEAAGTGSAIAHQVHGAIGFTKEYVLHRFSLRTLGWRDDFGNESYWAVELGHLVAKRGADDLWPLVASR
ncbi:acyl-CoA dehydrogenase [Afipia sp. P52-10]|uniref:acyl-CoA dehydrogenase family protein n=1 Tax=Afipia sp. P52-10 TaxID=1429916 RepID=UPI0003DF4679|nr:acyl-CoA dehydrogenase family protein [Afipia sp. P52-10]ETR78161.1 acyl-CoA dehydrogenase [Afipia sp. P52-10]